MSTTDKILPDPFDEIFRLFHYHFPHKIANAGKVVEIATPAPYHLAVHFSSDNTANWINFTSPLISLSTISVSCWLLMHYEKAKDCFLEDFKSLASSSPI